MPAVPRRHDGRTSAAADAASLVGFIDLALVSPLCLIHRRNDDLTITTPLHRRRSAVSSTCFPPKSSLAAAPHWPHNPSDCDEGVNLTGRSAGGFRRTPQESAHALAAAHAALHVTARARDDGADLSSDLAKSWNRRTMALRLNRQAPAQWTVQPWPWPHRTEPLRWCGKPRQGCCTIYCPYCSLAIVLAFCTLLAD